MTSDKLTGEFVHPFLYLSHFYLFSELSIAFLDVFWLIFQVNYWCFSSQILGTLFLFIYWGGKARNGLFSQPSKGRGPQPW